MKKVWIVLVLFLGGLIGGFYLDHYVEGLLFEVLEDELKASTPCKLKSDSWEVSLLTLSAFAKNPRVECPDGTTPLRLDSIKGKFSIKKIWDKKIVIDPLILEGGYAEGLIPGKVPFDFIYYLSTPLPPEKASTGFKARLERLKVINTTLRDSKLKFESKNSSLEFRRNDKDEVTLQPVLKNITFSDFLLDEVKAEIKGNEQDEVKVEGLTIIGPSASLIGKVYSEKGLSGEISGIISPPEPFSGEINTTSFLSSEEELIHINTNLSSQDLRVSEFNLSPFLSTIKTRIGETTSLESDEIIFGDFSLKNFDLRLTPNIKATGQLIINETKIEGVQIGQGNIALEFENEIFKAEGILTNLVTPLDTIEELKVTAQGNLDNFSLKANSSKLDAEAIIKSNDIKVVFSLDEFGRISGKGEYRENSFRFNGIFNNNITIQASGKEKLEFSGAGVSGSFEKRGDYFLLQAEINRYEYKPCLLVSAKVDYKFKDPKVGSGSIKDIAIVPDCDIEPIRIQDSINISEGIIKLDNFKILSGNLSGAISLLDGYDLKVYGSIPLAYFASFTPGIDELSGDTSLDLKVTGELTSPVLQGTFSIENGIVEKESLNLEVSNLRGVAEINDKVIVPKDITAEINGGIARIEGIINLGDLSSSVGTLTFREVSLEPDNEISITASGSLTVTTEPFLLSGIVTVNSGEIRKYLNIRSLVTETIRGIFERDIAMSKEHSSDIPVSVILQIPQSLFVQTNFFEAELSGDLKVGGTLGNLDIIGVISTENGWLGLRGRRFDITDGKVFFRGAGSEPTLRILSESMFLPSEQDAVSVFLEVDGTLSNPIINLASDRNLTDQQLLNIITGGTSESELTQVNTQFQTGSNNEEFSLFDAIPFLPFPSFLRDLTKIDTLAIDPRYDPFSGQYEPVVSARKRLNDQLELVGESSFQGTRSSSGVKLIYNLNPKLNIIGLLRSLPYEQQTVVGVDVTWTILARRAPRINFELEGNRNLSFTQVLSAMSVTPYSVVSDIEQLKTRLETRYRDLGFPDIKTDFKCTEQDNGSCKRLIIKINEGQDQRLKGITSDPIPVKLPEVTDDRATADRANELARIVTNRLRNEGYVAARVSPFYNCEGYDCILHLNVTLGTPLTFIFKGNKLFTADDFLKSIRLFTRKQPFGVNTPSILHENIISMYQSAGYPFVSVNRTKTEESGRVIHTFEIVEGEATKISEVKVISPFDLEGLVETKEIYSIREAKSELIERARSIILLALRRAGYVEPTVDFKIEGGILIFTTSGTPMILPQKLNIIGAEDLPPLPDLPLSPLVLKSFENTVLDYLKEKGYRDVATELDFDTLRIKKGEQYILKNVSISGNLKISEKVIKEAIKEYFEQPLSEKRGFEIQSALLKLGLFQKVTVNLDGHTALIFVEERPLTTLEVGGGYSSSLGVHIFGESTDKSLFADGKSLTLRLDGYMNSLDGSFNQGIASVRFLEPSVFGSDWSFATETSFQRQELATYEFDLNRSILGGSLFRSWDSGLTFSGGYRILEENLKNVSPGAQLSELDSGNVVLGMLSSGVTLDKRDYALNPSSGYIVGLDSSFASEDLGSDANYGGFNIKGTHYTPLSSRWVWLMGFQAGKKWTFRGTDYVPISQRYYLGGRGSVRGYNENSLGPRGEDGAVIGGEELLRGNLELQYLIYDDLSVLGFYDIGRIRLPGIEFDNNFQSGTGLGFRYLSPIGPIGLDFSHGLDNVPGSRTLRVTFEIGVAF